MVKRLRRRPLTAESGVRFPMGVPKTSPLWACFSFYHGELHTLCAQLRCTNPRTLGWRSTMQVNLFVSLLRSLCSLRFPWGYQKTCTFVWVFLFPRGALCVDTHATLLHEPQNTGLTLIYASKLARFTIPSLCSLRFPMGVPKNKSYTGLFFYTLGNCTLCVRNWFCLKNCLTIEFALQKC